MSWMVPCGLVLLALAATDQAFAATEEGAACGFGEDNQEYFCAMAKNDAAILCGGYAIEQPDCDCQSDFGLTCCVITLECVYREWEAAAWMPSPDAICEASPAKAEEDGSGLQAIRQGY